MSLTNEKLEAALLQQANTMAPTTERNKYVMIGNPAAIIASQATDGSPGDFQNRINEMEKEFRESIVAIDQNLKTLTMMQKSLIVNESVSEFFIANFNFWDSVIQSFDELNGIAEKLKTKIQKAK
jgi:hypothetical protein